MGVAIVVVETMEVMIEEDRMAILEGLAAQVGTQEGLVAQAVAQEVQPIQTSLRWPMSGQGTILQRLC